MADRARTDQFAPIGGVPRVWSVWIWYPAVPGQGTASAYAPGPWAGLHRAGSTRFDRIRTGTRDDAPPAAGTFPIAVLLPDLGLAAPQYASLAAGLAARGYLVAAITPTYSARLTVLNDHPVPASAAGSTAGPQLTSVWAADARHTAGQVALRFGTQAAARVVYAGHGSGGAAALVACAADPRCAGAASLDGTPAVPPPDRPLLLLDASPGASPWPAPVLAFTVRGPSRLAVSDQAVYRRLAPGGGSRRFLDITTGYVGAFLDTATRGAAWQPPAAAEVQAAGMLGR
jgi:dienelactone hydrolase